MNSLAALSGLHRQTYQRLFSPSGPPGMEWRKVAALLEHLGAVIREGPDHLRVTRNGHDLILHRTPRTDLSEVRAVMQLRNFLQRSSAPLKALAPGRIRWLLVIDHHKARILRCDDAGPGTDAIPPRGPPGFPRPPPGSKQFSRRPATPDAEAYFGPIGNALKPPGQIVIFARGPQVRRDLEAFVAWAKERRPILASQIVGTGVVESPDSTDGEMVATAWARFWAPSPPGIQAGRARRADPRGEPAKPPGCPVPASGKSYSSRRLPSFSAKRRR